MLQDDFATLLDAPFRRLRDHDSLEQEVRAALACVVRLCPRRGVERLREVVLGEEPVFYVDEER